jgi:hypothetical protein
MDVSPTQGVTSFSRWARGTNDHRAGRRSARSYTVVRIPIRNHHSTRCCPNRPRWSPSTALPTCNLVPVRRSAAWSPLVEPHRIHSPATGRKCDSGDGETACFRQSSAPPAPRTPSTPIRAQSVLGTRRTERNCRHSGPRVNRIRTTWDVMFDVEALRPLTPFPSG